MPAFQRYKVRLCRIKTEQVAVFCGEDLYSSPGDILLDSRLLHTQWTDFAALCGGLLGLTPAFQRYKVCLCRMETHEFAVLCGGCTRSQAGDTLLDGRLLHNRWTDCDSVCGRLLGLTPASRRYMVRLCHIETQEFAIFCGEDLYSSFHHILLDSGLLHNRWTDFDALCRRLLGSTPAFQRYRVRLCRIKAQEFAVFCGGSIRYHAGDILLDGGLLHNRRTDFDSVCRRLLGSPLASQ